jgi:DNA-binding MarR family transcriptional regulator
MADDLGKLLRLAADGWHEELRRALAGRAPAAAIGAGAAVLRQLDGGGLKQTELTARMGFSKQAVQQLLDQLEADGLVRRLPDPADRRIRHVERTERGAELAALRETAETELEQKLRDTLGRKRVKALRKALREIAPR